MRTRTARPTPPAIRRIGPIGRLGYWTTTHFRWVLVALGLGAFALRAEKALSGAGWEATGSQSVQARELIDENFDGLSGYGLTVVVHSRTQTSGDPAFRTVVERAQPEAELPVSLDTVATGAGWKLAGSTVAIRLASRWSAPAHSTNEKDGPQRSAAGNDARTTRHLTTVPSTPARSFPSPASAPDTRARVSFRATA